MSIHLDESTKPVTITESVEADSALGHDRKPSQATTVNGNGNGHDHLGEDTRLFPQSISGTKHFSTHSRVLVVSPSSEADALSPTSTRSAGVGGGLSRSSSMIRSPHRNRASFASIRSMGMFGGTWREQRVGLNVVDTPGLAFEEGRELELERQLRGLMRIVGGPGTALR